MAMLHKKPTYIPSSSVLLGYCRYTKNPVTAMTARPIQTIAKPNITDSHLGSRTNAVTQQNTTAATIKLMFAPPGAGGTVGLTAGVSGAPPKQFHVGHTHKESNQKTDQQVKSFSQKVPRWGVAEPDDPTHYCTSRIPRPRASHSVMS